MKRWFRRVRSRVFPQYIRADLHSTLQSANPDAPLDTRVEWLASLMEWARLPATPEALAQKTGHIEATRVRFLLARLERNPELQAKVGHTFQSIFGVPGNAARPPRISWHLRVSIRALHSRGV